MLTLIMAVSSAPVVHASPVEVFVSLLPQKWLAEQVGGDNVEVHVLVSPGQEPHNFSPTPRQIAQLYKARIYFTVGMAFEQQILEKIKTSTHGVQFVNTVARIDKIPVLPVGHGKDLRKTTREFLDPHVWLDPENLLLMADEMAKALISADADHGNRYEKRLAQLRQRLEELDATLSQRLAPCRGTTFFVFHPAFGYFAHAYGLRQKAVESGGKSPRPRQLRALIKQARADQVRVIFVQPQFDARSAKAVASAVNGEVVVLDPLGENVVGNLQLMAEKIGSSCHGR